MADNSRSSIDTDYSMRHSKLQLKFVQGSVIFHPSYFTGTLLSPVHIAHYQIAIISAWYWSQISGYGLVLIYLFCCYYAPFSRGASSLTN